MAVATITPAGDTESEHDYTPSSSVGRRDSSRVDSTLVAIAALVAASASTSAEIREPAQIETGLLSHLVAQST